jgi:glutathione peroxidase-family protein
MSSSPQNFFSFTVLNKFRKPEELKQFAGQVVLAVNVASKCGFTKQYAGLEQLFRKYKGEGFSVIGFPSNEFGGQEPGSEAEIEQFCTAKFDVTFPLMGKLETNGDNQAPLYSWMKSQKSQLGMKRIKWNFEKFLINRQGQVVDRYSSMASPESIAEKIEQLLQEPKPQSEANAEEKKSE